MFVSKLALATLPALAVSACGLTLREVGSRNTLDWRVWLERNGNPVSFWHDVPLYPDEDDHRIVNMVVEIPRWTDGKIEISRDEPMNPIFHDDKDGEPRFVASYWPMKTYPFLYGSIPQTWENPNHDDDFTGYPGDNDPVDCFDIGRDAGFTGQVKKVKILGGLAMIDDDATDWKIMVIDVTDPLSEKVDSFEDLEKYTPGLVQAYYDWFVKYKVARGKGTNEIVGDEYQDASYIEEFLETSHGYWQDLVAGDAEDSNEINYNQTTNAKLDESWVDPHNTTEMFGIPAESKVEPPAAKPEEFGWWYYLDEDFELVWPEEEVP